MYKDAGGGLQNGFSCSTRKGRRCFSLRLPCRPDCLYDFAAVTPAVDQTIERVTDGGNAPLASLPLAHLYEYNPEARSSL
jgi:hypothetical protein